MKAIAEFWDDSIVPAIIEYIRIPAKSPHFDRDWRSDGHIEARSSSPAWCRAHPLDGMKLEVVRLDGPHAGAVLEVRGDSAGKPC